MGHDSRILTRHMFRTMVDDASVDWPLAYPKGVLRAIDEARPEALLVAMGFPRQEEWIANNLPRLQVNVAVAEGGSFSFISGTVPRAPLWLRRLGLEWLYRLALQPWRLRRQLAIPQFVWLVVSERLRRS